MRSFLFLISTIVVLGSASAQNDFIREYDVPAFVLNTDVDENGVVAVLSSDYSTSYLTVIEPDGHIRFTKEYSMFTDSSGMHVWSDLSFTDLTVIPDSGFLMVGTAENPLDPTPNGGSKNIAMRMDTLGNVVWVHQRGEVGIMAGYGGFAEYDSQSGILIGADASTFPTGRYVDRVSYTDGSIDQGRTFLGGMFGYSDVAVGSGEDGKIFHSGRNSALDRSYLTCLDPNFDTIWNKAWTGYFRSPYKMIGLNDGSLIGTTRISNYVIRYDEFGNWLWAKQIHTDQTVKIEGIAMRSDSAILVAGSKGGCPNWCSSWLICFDQNGNDLWARQYWSSSGYEVFNIDVLPDDQLLLTGRDGLHTALVIGTDSTGVITDCVQPILNYWITDVIEPSSATPPQSVPGSSMVGFNYENGTAQPGPSSVFTPCGAPVGIKENESRPFQVYPNPTNGSATIEFATQPLSNTRIDLIDVNGKVVRTMESPSSKRINVQLHELGIGIYSLVLRSPNEVQSARIVIH